MPVHQPEQASLVRIPAVSPRSTKILFEIFFFSSKFGEQLFHLEGPEVQVDDGELGSHAGHGAAGEPALRGYLQTTGVYGLPSYLHRMFLHN